MSSFFTNKAQIQQETKSYYIEKRNKNNTACKDRLKARSHTARRRTSTSMRQRTTSYGRRRPLLSVVVRRRTGKSHA